MKFFYYLQLGILMVISIFTILVSFSVLFGVIMTMILGVFSL